MSQEESIQKKKVFIPTAPPSRSPELLGMILDNQMVRSQQGVAERRKERGLPPFRGGA